MKEFLVLTEELGEEFRTTSLSSAYHEWRRLVADDKEHHDVKHYYFEVAETEGNIEYRTEVKIYKRGNKIYCKSL